MTKKKTFITAGVIFTVPVLLWKFLADLSGVLNSIAIIKEQTIYLYFQIINNKTILNCFLILVTVIIILIALLVLTNIRKIRSFARKTKIKKEMEKYDKREFIKDLNRFIPKKAELKNWVKQINYVANKWAEDALMDGLYLYISGNDKSVSVDLTANFYSAWKNQINRIALRRGSIDSEIEENTLNIHNPVIKYFFDLRGWKKAILSSFDKVKDQLPPYFQIQIANHEKPFSINISYKIGEVRKKKVFNYDGKTLTEVGSKTPKRIVKS